MKAISSACLPVNSIRSVEPINQFEPGLYFFTSAQRNSESLPTITHPDTRALYYSPYVGQHAVHQVAAAFLRNNSSIGDGQNEHKHKCERGANRHAEHPRHLRPRRHIQRPRAMEKGPPAQCPMYVKKHNFRLSLYPPGPEPYPSSLLLRPTIGPPG